MRGSCLYVVAAAGLFLLFAGCGLTFVSELAAPTDVVATTNQVEQITITWSHVPNANHYYIYRSLLPAGPFGPEVGPLYRTVEGNGLVDINVPDSDYYYRVSAADGFGRLESPMADVVHGTALVAPPTWRLPVLTGFGTGLVDIAVDRLLPEEPLYVLTAPAAEGAQLSVSLVTANGTLAPVGDPFGAVDGTAPGSAAIAVAGGALFVASTSDTGVLDLVAEMVLWRFNSGSGIWVAEAASASLSNAELLAPWIDIEARSPTDLFLAYRAKGGPLDGPIASYRYDGATATDIAATLAVGAADVTSVHLSLTATTEALIYKDMLLLDTPIMVSRLFGGLWDTPTAISDGLDAVPDGYVDSSIDPTTNDLYVAYYDTTNSELVVKENNAATRISPDPGPADAATPSVAITARNGEVTVFYTDSLGVGIIEQFTGAWSTISPDPLTFGGALSSLGVHATAGGLFIGYIEATVGVVRRYY